MVQFFKNVPGANTREDVKVNDYKLTVMRCGGKETGREGGGGERFRV